MARLLLVFFIGLLLAGCDSDLVKFNEGGHKFGKVADNTPKLAGHLLEWPAARLLREASGIIGIVQNTKNLAGISQLVCWLTLLQPLGRYYDSDRDLAKEAHRHRSLASSASTISLAWLTMI